MGDMRHQILEDRMCREIDLIEEKYRNNNSELAIDDLKKLDMLYHTLKSKETYDAMVDANRQGYSDNLSGRSMRMSGHYPDERGMGYSGYSGGYYPGYYPRW